MSRDGGVQPAIPPSIVIGVKALACQLPKDYDLPLSRFSLSEEKRCVEQRGLVASVGETTLWRRRHEDAIRPWYHRTWIFPRGPEFAAKAGRVGCALAKHHGRWETTPGIAPFDRLAEQVMALEPHRSARGVSWIMDNGASHRGQPGVVRLRKRWPTIRVVHTPVHASWLNQVEICFSIVQRKVLTPNDIASLEDLQERLLRFQEHYEAAARPFAWTFTRADLNKLLARIRANETLAGAA